GKPALGLSACDRCWAPHACAVVLLLPMRFAHDCHIFSMDIPDATGGSALSSLLRRETGSPVSVHAVFWTLLLARESYERESSRPPALPHADRYPPGNPRVPHRDAESDSGFDRRSTVPRQTGRLECEGYRVLPLASPLCHHRWRTRRVC